VGLAHWLEQRRQPLQALGRSSGVRPRFFARQPQQPRHVRAGRRRCASRSGAAKPQNRHRCPQMPARNQILAAVPCSCAAARGAWRAKFEA